MQGIEVLMGLFHEAKSKLIYNAEKVLERKARINNSLRLETSLVGRGTYQK